MPKYVSKASAGIAAALLMVAAQPALAAADLARAAADQNIKKIDKLLAAGAAIDEVDGEGRSAFFHAAAKGDLSLMEKFAGKGANIGLRDKTGATPLLAALRNPATQTTALEFLLAKGADVNAADDSGRTPLMEAVLRAPGVLDTDAQVAVVSLMLKSGADTSKTDVTGAAAVHHAAYVGEPRKVLELLLGATANTSGTTISGANVLMMAAQNHQRSNADYLMARGFRPVRIQAAPLAEGEKKPDLAQDMSFRANALSNDWWGQYAGRKGDPAAAKTAFGAAVDDYEAAATESARMIKVYEAKLVKDKQARNNQRAAAGVATALSVALTLGAGGGYYTIYMPALQTEVEQDEAAIAALKADNTEFTARAKALRVQLAAN